MKIAIMQPYFLPYLGYWQLLNAVDVFVIYDNIKYTKKGWINRNRFLLNGKAETFTLPLKADSDSLDIDQRFLADTFDREGLVRKLTNAYNKSIYTVENQDLIPTCVNRYEKNLFKYIFSSIGIISKELGIHTKIVRSSELPFEHKALKSQDKVLAICEHFGATQYINPIGGTELYNHADFSAKNIELKFLKSQLKPYRQLGNEFVSGLSIIDPILCTGMNATKKMLEEYDLV